MKKEVKINYIGERTPFPDDLKSILVNYVKKTKDFDKLTITFALNYGGRDDLVRAVNKIIEKGYKNITEQQLLQELDTKDLPEPDFVIRTSGEQRLSNFMLYQMAYSELYFSKVYWPSFNEKHFTKALKVYEKRKRRYGGLS